MTVHQGHRARIRNRFLEEGLDGFDEHQVLEFLLFYAIPQKDTNEIAHNLLKRFGSLSQVIDSPVKELCKVAGIGENTAIFISLINQLERYYHKNRYRQTKVLNNLDECGEYMVPFFYSLTKETVFLLCLDAKRKVISCRAIDEGGVNCTGVSIRKIVDAALTENATSVILAHNHTSGVAIPSDEDIRATYQIARALQYVDVLLMDHIVVAEDDFVSMVHSGCYQPMNIDIARSEALP